MQRVSKAILSAAVLASSAGFASAGTVHLSDASHTFFGEPGPDQLVHASRGFASLWSPSASNAQTVNFSLTHQVGGGAGEWLIFTLTQARRPATSNTGATLPPPIVRTLACEGSFNVLTLVARATADGSFLNFSNLTFSSGSLTTLGQLGNGHVAPGTSGVNAPEGNGWHRQYVLGDTDLTHHDWILTGTLTGSRPLNSPGSIGFDIEGFQETPQPPPTPVPLPPAAWSGLATLGLVGGLGLFRVRKLRRA